MQKIRCKQYKERFPWSLIRCYPVIKSIFEINDRKTGKFKFNWARYANAELDQLLEDAESAETQEVKDDLYMQIQKHIMDQAVFLAIHDQVQTVAYNPDLEGVRFANGNWQMRMYDVRKK